MKKLAALFLAALMLTACGKKEAVQETQTPTQPPAVIEGFASAPEETTMPEASAPELQSITAEPVTTETQPPFEYHDPEWPDPPASAFLGTWCTDRWDHFLFIGENMTCAFCDRQANPDAVLRFWEQTGPNSIVFCDGEGGIRETFTAYGDAQRPILHDSAGNRYTRCDKVISGRYLCLLTGGDAASSADGTLYITRVLETWYTEDEVEAMKTTKQLPVRKPFGPELQISTIEEQPDGTILLNGELVLDYYGNMNAWKLVGFQRTLAGIGPAPISENCAFLDMYHRDVHNKLSDCVLPGENVTAYLSFYDGSIICIETVEPY